MYKLKIDNIYRFFSKKKIEKKQNLYIYFLFKIKHYKLLYPLSALIINTYTKYQNPAESYLLSAGFITTMIQFLPLLHPKAEISTWYSPKILFFRLTDLKFQIVVIDIFQHFRMSKRCCIS